MFGIKTLLKRQVRTSKALRRNWRILRDTYGQHRSLWREQCLDANGNYVPWFTYPAIEYLNQLDLSHMRVLEFGSGFSTLYWAKRTKHVTSVEDSKSWYERMKKEMPANANYIPAPTHDDIVRAATEVEGPFDLIVNDGLYRYDCAVA